ncbi:hypothetical protein HYT00_01010 [Candidatus Giovannonibacteria bacterium]|nr:hypothetical protein [Candidatus Giovannonibacteria bacterium]
MNEEEIIEQIKKLKKLGPKQPELSLLKKEVFARIEAAKKEKPQQSPYFIYWPFSHLILSGAIAALLLFALSAAFYEPLNTQVRYSVNQIRIMAAGNQYRKAELALNFAEGEFERFSKNPSRVGSGELEKATAITNEELGKLNLTGEAGKYTTEECKKLYLKFDTMLHELADLAKKENAQAFLRQIEEYEKIADQKLNMY